MLLLFCHMGSQYKMFNLVVLHFTWMFITYMLCILFTLMFIIQEQHSVGKNSWIMTSLYLDCLHLVSSIVQVWSYYCYLNYYQHNSGHLRVLLLVPLLHKERLLENPLLGAVHADPVRRVRGGSCHLPDLYHHGYHYNPTTFTIRYNSKYTILCCKRNI